MTEFDHIDMDAMRITAVTKHIKIYSDNPMHDAIDRIINSCLCIDEGDDYCHMATLELEEAAHDLLILANARIADIKRLYQGGIYEQKHNKS